MRLQIFLCFLIRGIDSRILYENENFYFHFTCHTNITYISKDPEAILRKTAAINTVSIAGENFSGFSRC